MSEDVWGATPQQYVELRIPHSEWALGRVAEFLDTCRLAGATDDTPLTAYTWVDPKVGVMYLVLRCDITT